VFCSNRRIQKSQTLEKFQKKKTSGVLMLSNETNDEMVRLIYAVTDQTEIEGDIIETTIFIQQNLYLEEETVQKLLSFRNEKVFFLFIIIYVSIFF
jgi:hypothetical protein